MYARTKARIYTNIEYTLSTFTYGQIDMRLKHTLIANNFCLSIIYLDEQTDMGLMHTWIKKLSMYYEQINIMVPIHTHIDSKYCLLSLR